MTLAEFHSKPLASKTDAAAVVKSIPFEEVCEYIADGPDTKVATLLAGLWVSRAAFTNHQIVRAAVCALFPNKAYMRRTTSSSGIMLAKAAGCQEDLQRIIKERWISIRERECNEIVLGISDTKDIAGWMPTLRALFDLNRSNDIRTELVRAVNNLVRATELPEARRVLADFLYQMPVERGAYSNANNFDFIHRLRTPMARRD